MSRVQFVAAVTDTNLDAAPDVPTSFTPIPLPAAVQTGDLLLVAVTSPYGAPTVISPPDDGWTLLRRIDNGALLTLALYYKFALGEPNTLVFTFSPLSGVFEGDPLTEGTYCAILTVYRNVDRFYPFDVCAGQATPAATSHSVPALTTATPEAGRPVQTVGFWAIATTGDTGTWTAPTNWRARKAQFNTDNNLYALDMFAADVCQGSGTIGTTATINTSAWPGCACYVHLRQERATLTISDATRLYKGLYPPGADDLYDWDTSTASIYKVIRAEAQALKDLGLDWLDMLRAELRPSKAAVLLDRWESVFGLGGVGSTTGPSTLERQQSVIGKFREHGQVTLNQIRNAVAPPLGYSDPSALLVIEALRADLKSALTLESGEIDAAIVDSLTVVLTNRTHDGPVSAAGPQVRVTITHAHIEDLWFTLSGPGGYGVTWDVGILSTPGSGNVASEETFYLYGPSLAGQNLTVLGDWTLDVKNVGGTVGSLISWGLFVEGAGFDSARRTGHGGQIFEWAVVADVALAGVASPADYEGAVRAIQRISPAYSHGSLILGSGVDGGNMTGTVSIKPDNAYAFPGGRADNAVNEPGLGQVRGCIPG